MYLLFLGLGESIVLCSGLFAELVGGGGGRQILFSSCCLQKIIIVIMGDVNCEERVPLHRLQ